MSASFLYINFLSVIINHREKKYSQENFHKEKTEQFTDRSKQKMAKTRVSFMSFLVLAMVVVVFPSQIKALMPYTRPFWDIAFPPEDPFRILEQTPLTIPKGVESIALTRSDWKETATEHVITLDIPGMKKCYNIEEL